jgi:hypothetical protein
MSISVFCIPLRVKGSIWSVSNVFPEICPRGEVYSCGLFDGLEWPAEVGSNEVLIVRKTNISIDRLTTYLKWVGTI